MFKVLGIIVDFFHQLGLAIYFRAAQYDVKLQRTKTPKERVIIWVSVIAIASTIFAVITVTLGRLIMSTARFNP